jgi:uncharacterized RDD family membrane protein YckC
MNLNNTFLELYFNLTKPKEYGGFFLRLIAFLIDFIILMIIKYLVAIAFNLDIEIRNELFHPIYLGAHPANLIIVWLYFAVLESSTKQATIGKFIMKLKVVDVNNNKISFGKASIRFFVKIFSGLIFGIGFIMIAFTKHKQGLHDLAAGTYVKINYE